MRSGFAPCASSFARTIALTIAIEVTSNVGTAVQRISSPVCPWMGGPSESSSGLARNFQTANTLTAATIEKTKMQMPVTNQKTKSIRPASRDAGCGSQRGIKAKADAMAPARTPITISWTIEPLRTDAASLLDWSVEVRRFSPDVCGESPAHITRRLNGTRSWNLPDRDWRNPHIRRQRVVELSERRRRRLDSDGGRSREHPALAALLAVVGRTRLLVAPADDVRRRRPTADVLGSATRRARGRGLPRPRARASPRTSLSASRVA